MYGDADLRATNTQFVVDAVPQGDKLSDMNAPTVRKDRILVVDDEPEIITLVSYHLEAGGYDVVTAADGRAAIAEARNRKVDLIVLDLMLPDISGFEVLSTLRGGDGTKDLPFLLLSALREDTDRIRGLTRGADDYLTKPFHPEELVLRVRAILRRSRLRGAPQQVEKIGDLTIDRLAHEVRVAGVAVDLTPTEYRLLALLAENAGEIQPRRLLLQAIWGAEPDMQTRTIDVHVQRLRFKLGRLGNLIETVRGFGYRFSVPEEPKV